MSGFIEMTGKFKPKNNGSFALMDAEDISYRDGRVSDYIPCLLTADEYAELEASGAVQKNIPYIIIAPIEEQ